MAAENLEVMPPSFDDTERYRIVTHEDAQSPAIREALDATIDGPAPAAVATFLHDEKWFGRGAVVQNDATGTVKRLIPEKYFARSAEAMPEPLHDDMPSQEAQFAQVQAVRKEMRLAAEALQAIDDDASNALGALIDQAATAYNEAGIQRS